MPLAYSTLGRNWPAIVHRLNGMLWSPSFPTLAANVWVSRPPEPYTTMVLEVASHFDATRSFFHADVTSRKRASMAHPYALRRLNALLRRQWNAHGENALAKQRF
jgi:hypothetical protein